MSITSTLATVNRLKGIRAKRTRLRQQAKAARPSTEADQVLREVRIRFETGDAFGSFELFCTRLVRITTKRPGEIVPLTWNRAQREIMRRRTGRDVVLKGRQVGASTLEYARDVWFALTRTNTFVAIVVQAHKSNEPTNRVIRTLERIIELLGIDVGAGWAGPTVAFGNGSTITVLDAGGTEETAQKQGRGGTFHRVHVTESSSFKFGDETLSAILKAVPSIEKGGEYTEESTPKGAAGIFYDHCTGAQAGTNGLGFVFIPWFLDDDCKSGTDTTPAEPLDQEEHEILEAAQVLGIELAVSQLRWWRAERSLSGYEKTIQEYPHDPQKCFLLSGNSYFDAKALSTLEQKIEAPLTIDALEHGAAADTTPARPFRDKVNTFWRTVNRAHGSILRVWEPPKAGCSYAIVVDTASGKKAGDYLVGLVFERRSHRHVATLRAKVFAPEFARWIATLGWAYGRALVVVERNNHGFAVLYVLNDELHYPALWRKDPDDTETADLGFWTGPHNRQGIIDDLVDAVTAGEFDTHDPVFTSEARTFVRKPSGKVEAADGPEVYDDVIMAAAIGWRVIAGPRIAGVTPGTVANKLTPFG